MNERVLTAGESAASQPVVGRTESVRLRLRAYLQPDQEAARQVRVA